MALLASQLSQYDAMTGFLLMGGKEGKGEEAWEGRRECYNAVMRWKGLSTSYLIIILAQRMIDY